jgi:hypothetical protein
VMKRPLHARRNISWNGPSLSRAAEKRTQRDAKSCGSVRPHRCRSRFGAVGVQTRVPHQPSDIGHSAAVGHIDGGWTISEDAALDDGEMWPTSFAVTALTPAVEKAISVLSRRPAGTCIG